MKYIPLQGQPCKLYEIYTLTGNNCELYVTLYEIYTLTGINPVDYMKYIPLQGQPCKLYEIYTLTGATL